MEPFATTVRQATSLAETAHRPWPPPEETWVMAQTWQHLLFAHWRVPAEELRPLLPPALSLDTYDGSAWVGMAPFRLTGLRLHGLPPLPVLSSCLELNVRTYVSFDGKPGVWFFSLDASSLAVVHGARRLYSLPYAHARMSCARVAGGRVRFRSERRDPRLPPAAFAAEYGAAGPVRHPEAGTLEAFLVERYCLYAERDGALLRAEIHHRPWPLQPASGRVEAKGQAPPAVRLPKDAPLLHYAERLDVLVWPPRRARTHHEGR